VRLPAFRVPYASQSYRPAEGRRAVWMNAVRPHLHDDRDYGVDYPGRRPGSMDLSHTHTLLTPSTRLTTPRKHPLTPSRTTTPPHTPFSFDCRLPTAHYLFYHKVLPDR